MLKLVRFGVSSMFTFPSFATEFSGDPSDTIGVKRIPENGEGTQFVTQQYSCYSSLSMKQTTHNYHRISQLQSVHRNSSPDSYQQLCLSGAITPTPPTPSKTPRSKTDGSYQVSFQGSQDHETLGVLKPSSQRALAERSPPAELQSKNASIRSGKVWVRLRPGCPSPVSGSWQNPLGFAVVSICVLSFLDLLFLVVFIFRLRRGCKNTAPGFCYRPYRLSCKARPRPLH